MSISCCCFKSEHLRLLIRSPRPRVTIVRLPSSNFARARARVQSNVSRNTRTHVSQESPILSESETGPGSTTAASPCINLAHLTTIHAPRHSESKNRRVCRSEMPRIANNVINNVIGRRPRRESIASCALAALYRRSVRALTILPTTARITPKWITSGSAARCTRSARSGQR
jgi:hypothetical protein